MKIVLMKKTKAPEKKDMFVVLCLMQSVLLVLIVLVMYGFTRVNADTLDGIRENLSVIFSADFDVGGYFTPFEGNGKGQELPGNMNYVSCSPIKTEAYIEADITEEVTEEIAEAVFVVPVSGTVTSAYGYREHPVYSGESFHNGLDIAAEEGSPVYAVTDGVVTEASQAEMAGKYVKILHSDGKETLYCHCSELLTFVGEEVKAGDVIALVGQTGLATGPHLHFELHENGNATDPDNILGKASHAHQNR